MNTTRSPRIVITAVSCIGVLLFSGFVTWTSPLAQAATVVGCPTTKAALHTDIASAGNGGTVKLSCPSATSITFPTPVTITRNVTLDASGSPRAITLSGHGKTHLFNVSAGDKFTVNSLILSQGHVSAGHTNDGKGGAIYNHKSDLTVTDSTFSGNSGAQGGAIYNNGGSLNITNSTFSRNSARFFGGAIGNNGGTLTVDDSTFSRNSGAQGGAIGNNGGTLTVAHSMFSRNSGAQGGAIYNLDSIAVVTDSEFSKNSGQDSGGAIENGNGTLTVAGNTFSANSVQGFGGAIESVGNSSLTVAGSTFSANSASGHRGGAICLRGGTLTVTNSTFSGNSADQGGALWSLDTSLNIADSTFSGNLATTAGGAIFNSLGKATVTASIISDSTSGGNCQGSGITDGGYNLTDSDGNCGLSGLTDIRNTDPQVEPLAHNGGPTQTMALNPASPAIDKIPVSSGDCPKTDQRGVSRLDNSESACDIGAYEYVDTVQHAW